MKKLFFAVIAFSVISCGGDKKEEVAPETPAVEETAPAEAPAEATPAVADLSIEALDEMKYNVTELKVKAGQKVKLTLKHVGKMSKDMMGHNWVLLKQGVDPKAFGIAAVNAKDTNYVPADKEGDVIAHTKVVGGGESDTIEFDAPAPGTYDFICTFPGHFGTMHGKFIVE